MSMILKSSEAAADAFVNAVMVGVMILIDVAAISVAKTTLWWFSSDRPQ